ncbi:hypothetical protein SAY86_015927 [Trapa natans]|uniref:BHLH domain-containing protein n=1 Tax=Trapa natans TaxID=22666 RepID=A0AAN7LIS2_TRANT|nr:hypothetical protein SAY86_015927 [Trapa natans]
MENELLMSSLVPTWHSLWPAPNFSEPLAVGTDQSLACIFSSFSSADSTGDCLMTASSALSPLSRVTEPPPPHTYSSGHLYRESPPPPRWGHGFPELSAAARLSALGSRSFNGRRTGVQYPELAAMGKAAISRVWSSPSLRPIGYPNLDPKLKDLAELSNSQDDSTVSNPGLQMDARALQGQANWKKRTAANRGQNASLSKAGFEPDTEDDDGSDMKRGSRSEGDSARIADGSVKKRREGENSGDINAETKPPAEPPKDYIHVRARRGQATDSHSLAERVRREKISERMRILQDLVPGCSKVTGKALMLDEIINYVQALQHQVEFLSMKLANVNAGTDTLNPTTKDVSTLKLSSKAFLKESSHPYGMLSPSSSLSGQKNPEAGISDGTMGEYSVDPFIPSHLNLKITFSEQTSVNDGDTVSGLP